MNEHLINETSEVSGKTKTYLPINIIYFGDNFDKDYKEVIVVSSFLNEKGERKYNDVKFYSSVKATDISATEKAHFSYILQSSLDDSENTIDDIKNSPFFI